MVVHEGRILEKPESEAEARSFLEGYGRTPPSTVGSVLVTNLATRAQAQDLDTAIIHFKPIPPATIDGLMQDVESWSTSAGGLRVEHPLLKPYLVGIDGTQDSVMGLSKLLTMRLLLQAAGMQ